MSRVILRRNLAVFRSTRGKPAALEWHHRCRTSGRTDAKGSRVKARMHLAALVFALSMLVLVAVGRLYGQTRGQIEAEIAFVQALPEAPGKSVTVRICGGCHSVGEVFVSRLARQGWEEKIDEMFRNGAVVSDADVAIVRDYLFNVFPARLNINTANTMDFRRFLTLSEADGDRIVTYRQQHGAFKRWEDLKLVPGIDFKKIQDRNEILSVDPSPR